MDIQWELESVSTCSARYAVMVMVTSIMLLQHPATCGPSPQLQSVRSRRQRLYGSIVQHGAAPGELHFRRCSLDGGRGKRLWLGCAARRRRSRPLDSLGDGRSGQRFHLASDLPEAFWMLKSLLCVLFRFEDKFEIKGHFELHFCGW